MKPVYQLFAVLMLLGAPAFSQDVVSLNEFKCANSIIRTIEPNVYLLYNNDQWGKAHFVYYNGTGSVLSFQLPDGIMVSDVELDNSGNAWFCGKRNDDGVVGMFNIIGVFGGVDVVHYALLDMPYPDSIIHPCELTRLDLAYCDGTTVMAMVGGMKLYNEPTVYPAVVSATFNASSGQWDYCYKYNKDGDKVYTDIAVTENAIIAAAIDSSGRNSYLKAFQKTDCFPNNAFVDQQMEKITIPNIYCTGPMLITHMGANIFSTIQYGKLPCSVVSYLMKYNYFATTFDILGNYMTDMTECALEVDDGDMREIRHCGDTTVYALHHGHHPNQQTTGTESWMLPLHEGYNNSTINTYELNRGYAHSLDSTSLVGRPTVCGYDYMSQTLALSYTDVLASPQCLKSFPLAVIHFEPYTESKYNAEVYNQNNKTDTYYHPVIENNTKTIICH